MIKPNVIRAGLVPPNVGQVMGRDVNKIDKRNKNQLLFAPLRFLLNRVLQS